MDKAESNTIKPEEKIKTKKAKKKDDNDSESESSEEETKIETKDRPDVIHDNFILLSEMGKGAFGQIILTYNNRDQEEVALKKETKNPKILNPQLKTEYLVLKTLLKIQTTVQLPNNQEVPLDISGKAKITQEDIAGFPKFYGYGHHSDFYYIIIQLLGPNLNELFNFCNCKKFTITTTSMIAIQMLNRVEYMHKHHYIHRDIKPENFLIGCVEKSNIVYLIDYGLCKKYKDPKTHQHIAYREGRNLTGTARYVSINTHLGIEQSRRDDLESIGYVLVFFLKGSLPWQGLKGNMDKYNKIMEKKLQIPTEILCYGLPDEMTHYLNYCKSLRFEDRPDYDYLRGLFVKLIYLCANQYSIARENLKFDWCFDEPIHAWNLYKRKDPPIKVKPSDNKLIEFNKINPINENIFKKRNSEAVSRHMPKIGEIYEQPDKKNLTPMPESDNGDDDNSDATIINENFDIDLEFVYDKDPQELMKSAGILEDIDIYINRIKSKVSQQIKQKISDISKDNASDNTIEIKINNVVPINVGNNLDNESDNNSVINFIKNTKKLNYAATLEKREGIIEKNTSENDFLKAKSMNEKSIPKPEPSKPKDIEQGDGKISENDKINKKNDVKERRKSRINELANNANFQNNPILFKLSKDQMLKISTEAITNHYIILNDLGNGSYGTVKKVKHKISNEERAMKIVKKKSESSINEIEILKKISHPNIISIYEIFEDSKNYYIMSELIEGGELFEEITNRGSFSEIDAAKIMKQLLTSVNYLHNKNIVHRDLKPENIMMINKHSNNFEIKLIDFGTAKSFEKGDKLSKFIGTSYYIAPEVLAENYDEKCDIWSSGIILYILFCGYPPFDGNSNIDIYHSIKYSSPSFTSEEWKDVSKEAIDLIVNMLTKNPSKRLNAEQCLSHKWFKNMEALETDMIQKNKIKFNPLKALKKMTDFVTENKLKQMVIQFISTQFNLKEEEESLKNLFEQFDSNGKGYISIQCFTEVLTKYFGENEAKFFAQKIFSNIDNDGNGEISYNEFITSIMDKKILEKNQRIEKAFKMIDKDNSGRISLEEIRYLFGGDITKWKKIISDVDLNGDGEIDFEEFKKMLGFFDEKEINV